jgi:hypothetical protein
MLALFAALTDVLTRRKMTLHLINRRDCDESAECQRRMINSAGDKNNTP